MKSPSHCNHNFYKTSMAILEQQCFPDVDRSFRVVWQENIAFALAWTTTNCACDAAAEHRMMHTHHVSLHQQLLEGTLYQTLVR